jgi:hypothetical protein
MDEASEFNIQIPENIQTSILNRFPLRNDCAGRACSGVRALPRVDETGY